MTTETQVIERLVRVEEKIDHILQRFDAFTTDLTDHETRLRSMEYSSAKLLGMGTLAAAVSGIIGARIFDLLTSSPSII